VENKKTGTWDSGSRIRMKGKKAPERSHFTIMISKGSRKVKSFRISSRMWFGCIFLIGLWILSSFLCLALYVDTKRTGKFQEALVEKLQEQLRRTEDEFISTKESLKLMEESLDFSKSSALDQEKNRDLEHAKYQEKQVKGLQATVNKSNLSKNRIPERKAGQEEEVGIQKFAINRNGKELSVHFRITNEDPSHQQIAGYVFAIATDNEENQQGFWSYPETPLKNGVPIHYKRGKPFRIKNYRTIRCSYLLASPNTSIRSVNILVYNEMGKCILNRGINTESKSSN